MWKLRTNALVEGQTPRTVTHVLVEAMLKEARHIEDSEEVEAPAPVATNEEAVPLL